MQTHLHARVFLLLMAARMAGDCLYPNGQIFHGTACRRRSEQDLGGKR